MLSITSASSASQGRGRRARIDGLTTLLPMMTVAEALEATRLHHVSGLTGARTALVTARPFRAPPHPISDVGLIGGGHLPGRATCRWRTTACS